MKLLSLNRAACAPLQTLDGEWVQSAIRKRPIEGAVAVGLTGLDGDEQADLTVHGGLSKAVYAYPSEHYAFWQTVRAQAGVADWQAALPWGAMGENLSLSGLLEGQVWLGDRLCFADCELVVSEPLLRLLPGGAPAGHGAGRRGVSRRARAPGGVDPGAVQAGDAGALIRRFPSRRRRWPAQGPVTGWPQGAAR